jgi:hypothetical protein
MPPGAVLHDMPRKNTSSGKPLYCDRMQFKKLAGIAGIDKRLEG